MHRSSSAGFVSFYVKILTPLLSAHLAWAVDGSSNPHMTKEELKIVVRSLKKTIEKVDALENEGTSQGQRPIKPAAPTELNQLEEDVPGLPPVTVGSYAGSHSHASVGAKTPPTFKTYFDLNMVLQPGTQDFTFTNYHGFLFFEIIPTPDLQFSFDVNPNPRFFEVDYQVAKWVQLRVGKIWIPFDDMSPHNIFGGRTNVSRLAIGAPYLPDTWTDLGIGAKFSILDTQQIALTSHVYLVNGFRAGGTDPAAPITNPEAYPSFADLPTTLADNNRDKSFGGRAQAIFFNRLGIGASFFTGRWNAQNLEPQGLTIFGLDGQFRLESLEFRAGWSTMDVGVPAGSFSRGGFYGELGYKFAPKRDWKFLLRTGQLQLDSRINGVGDQQILGGTLLYKPGLVEVSIEHSRDLKVVPGKSNYTYTALRAIMAF